MVKILFFKFLLVNSILFGISNNNLDHNIKNLSLKEKVGHLFMIGIYQDRPIEEVLHYLHEYQVSNFLFVGRNWKPEKQRQIIAEMQKERLILFAEDLEYGLAQRMDDVVIYPRNMTLGAILNDNLIYDLGKEVGRQCRALGISLNLSPVVDVNSNPSNPVIGVRSFGDDPKRVAQLGINMMQGIKSEGVKTAAKHFPGHGNVVIDSHYSLPITENYELLPFIDLIQNNVDCILTAHLLIPSFDSENPVSLSKKWINFLKEDLQFKGLILTDDLLMKALYQPFNERALRAFIAGNHLLLFTENLPYNREAFIEGYNAIYNAVLSGQIAMEILDERVKEILTFKDNLSKDPTMESWITDKAIALKNRLYREAITRINNFPLEEPIQIMTNPFDPIYGKTLIYAGSPYHLSLLPKDRAIILAYEPGGIEQALIAIKENDFRGKLPIRLECFK